MTLWILRHGEAVNIAPTDASRPLTAGGREQVLRSARQLAGEPLQLILASPYLRAQQTAQIVHDALGGTTVELRTAPWLTPNSDVDAALTHLQSAGVSNLLLVSHQPLVGMLIGLLDRGERTSPHAMGTASLAKLEGAAPLAGLMTLRSLRHTPV
jgi:phosphohistidine phosphatase